MDYSIYECLQDSGYTNTFKFECLSGNYSLKFEKIAYGKNEFYEYVIFRALNYIFEEPQEFSVIANKLVYFIEDDGKLLTLIENDDIITGLLDEYYVENGNEVAQLVEDNSSEEVEGNEYIPFDETEDAVEKLMTENYKDNIIIKNRYGEKMILKRIGGVLYKKKEYIVAKIFQKTHEVLNKYIVYLVHPTNLETVENKRLEKKILKLCSKKYKIKLV